MTRYILCPACAERFNLHPEDAAEGWLMRKVPIKARRPDNHQITIHAGPETNVMTSIIPLPVLVCDHCNEELPDGSDAIAVSMWRKEEQAVDWEHEFSQP